MKTSDVAAERYRCPRRADATFTWSRRRPRTLWQARAGPPWLSGLSTPRTRRSRTRRDRHSGRPAPKSAWRLPGPRAGRPRHRPPCQARGLLRTRAGPLQVVPGRRGHPTRLHAGAASAPGVFIWPMMLRLITIMTRAACGLLGNHRPAFLT